MRTRGPDGKIWTAGASAIRQSDSRIYDSGSWGKKNKVGYHPGTYISNAVLKGVNCIFFVRAVKLA